jgi:hypothetical protein
MKLYQNVLTIGIVALVIVAAVSFTRGREPQPGQTLALQAPAFVRASEAGPEASDIGQRLSEEAGISAYLETSSPIDLNLVRDEFRTIETEEEGEYIVGSVEVPDHPEHFDVHVYVHSDGWILAYYMKDEATSKMVDVKAQTISSTKLKTVIAMIAGTLGEAVGDLKYYDFRYPNAESILMVAEDNQNGKDFTIELPSQYAYSERSWAMYDTHYGPDFRIDGSQAPKDWTGSNMGYGAIPASSLLVGTSHEIVADGNYGVLVITYRVP